MLSPPTSAAPVIAAVLEHFGLLHCAVIASKHQDVLITTEAVVHSFRDRGLVVHTGLNKVFDSAELANTQYAKALLMPIY